MSATTIDSPAVRSHAITAARTTTPRVIHSEWIKLRTLPLHVDDASAGSCSPSSPSASSPRSPRAARSW